MLGSTRLSATFHSIWSVEQTERVGDGEEDALTPLSVVGSFAVAEVWRT
jgi:hypothetical protein